MTDAPSCLRSLATARSCPRIRSPSIHMPKRAFLLTISCGPCLKLLVPIAVAGDLRPSSQRSLASWQLPRLEPRARKQKTAPGASQGVSAICACQTGMADAVLSTTRESEVARVAFQEPKTALVRIPTVAANVE